MANNLTTGAKPVPVAPPATRFDLCRLVLVTPTSQVDIALPGTVPLAALAPALLALAGRNAVEDGVTAGGWVLSQPGRGVLDSGKTAHALGLHDGDLIFLTHPDDALPEFEYDDVTEAIAEATRRDTPQWGQRAARWFSVAATITLALAAATLLGYAARPGPTSALAAFGLAVGLLGAGASVARGLGDRPVGAALAVAALPFAFTGGLLLLAGPAGKLAASRLLTAGTVVLLLTVLAVFAVAGGMAVLLAAGTGALALLVGAALTVAGLSPAGAAAVLATAALAATPLLPSIAIRLAGLPSPVVPQTPTDVIPEPARSHPDLLAGRVNAATRYLDGLFAGVTATCVGATGVLAAADTGYAAALGAVVAVALLLRADAFTGLGQHLILLTGGVVSLLAALIGIEAVAPGLVTIGALVAGLLLGVLGCVRTAWRQRPGSRPPSPYGGRLLDILEVLAVVAVVPLALAVLGVFDWVIDILGS